LGSTTKVGERERCKRTILQTLQWLFWPTAASLKFKDMLIKADIVVRSWS
jgi:hypothetical protein